MKSLRITCEISNISTFMKRFFPYLLFTLSAILLSTVAYAQDYNQKSDLKYRKWRITLFPPLSTNGIAAPKYTARYSINILGGYHGGLDGGEIGGLINFNKYYTNGLQLSGLANASGGSMAGVNISGGLNFSSDSMSGIQMSGLTNISGYDLEGIQIAGLFNLANRNSSGLQFSGLANVAQGNIEGLQGAGLVNASLGSISGLQASGIANVARKDVKGLQATGGINFAGEAISGLQAAGGANIALKNIEGLMAAGAVNISLGNAGGIFASGLMNVANNAEGIVFTGGANIANNLTGVQIAGLLNASQKATGVQIGLINVAKEFQGVPVGLISFYGNGRKNIDTRFSVGGFTDIGITLGTHRVYNSLLLGYNTLLNRNVYRFGLAVGLEKNISDSFKNWKSESVFVNQEFAVTHQFEEKWSDKLNLIYSYKYLFGKRFNNGFSMYAGPSLNAQISRVQGSEDYTWWSFWSPKRKGRTYRFWVGFTAGIRIFKQKTMPRFSEEFSDLDVSW